MINIDLKKISVLDNLIIDFDRNYSKKIIR